MPPEITLLQLYVEDFVATARWPQGLAGNWQRLPKLSGQLRLCTRSLFFEPDDVRAPIVRCALLQQLYMLCYAPCVLLAVVQASLCMLS